MSRNKKKERVLSLEEKQAIFTTLYDCSLELKLKIPRSHDREDMDKRYRGVLYTIAIEFVAKHEAYEGMAECIYNIMRNTLSATRRHWRVASKTEWILNKSEKSTGHLVDTRPPKNATAIYDTIEHTGLVWNNDRKGPVTLDCNLKLFLSPGVLAATDIYNNHHFFAENLKTDPWNHRDFLGSWCNALEAKKKDGSDFCATWSCVIEAMNEYDDYNEYKKWRHSMPVEESASCSSDLLFLPLLALLGQPAASGSLGDEESDTEDN